MQANDYSLVRLKLVSGRPCPPIPRYTTKKKKFHAHLTFPFSSHTRPNNYVSHVNLIIFFFKFIHILSHLYASKFLFYCLFYFLLLLLLLNVETCGSKSTHNIWSAIDNFDDTNRIRFNGSVCYLQNTLITR